MIILLSSGALQISSIIVYLELGLYRVKGWLLVVGHGRVRIHKLLGVNEVVVDVII